MADGRAKYLALSEEDKKLCEEERKAAVADGTFIPKESPKKKSSSSTKTKKVQKNNLFSMFGKKAPSSKETVSNTSNSSTSSTSSTASSSSSSSTGSVLGSSPSIRKLTKKEKKEIARKEKVRLLKESTTKIDTAAFQKTMDVASLRKQWTERVHVCGLQRQDVLRQKRQKSSNKNAEPIDTTGDVVCLSPSADGSTLSSSSSSSASATFTVSSSSTSSTQEHRRTQLLQFDDNQRPAFWGVWSDRTVHDWSFSNTISLPSTSSLTPRNPFGKVHGLRIDYDYDSDDEWENGEPGEVLHSDAEDDDDEEEEGVAGEGDGKEYATNDGWMCADDVVVYSDDEDYSDAEELADQDGDGPIDIEKTTGKRRRADEDTTGEVGDDGASRHSRKVRKIKQNGGTDDGMGGKLLIVEPTFLSFDEEKEKEKDEGTDEGTDGVDGKKSESQHVQHSVSTSSTSDPMEQNSGVTYLKQHRVVSLITSTIDPILFSTLEKVSTKQGTTRIEVSEEQMADLITTTHLTQSLSSILDEFQKMHPTVSSNSIKSKVREIALREKLNGVNGMCWRVHDDVLEKYGLDVSSLNIKGGKNQTIMAAMSKVSEANEISLSSSSFATSSSSSSSSSTDDVVCLSGPLGSSTSSTETTTNKPIVTTAKQRMAARMEQKRLTVLREKEEKLQVAANKEKVRLENVAKQAAKLAKAELKKKEQLAKKFKDDMLPSLISVLHCTKKLTDVVTRFKLLHSEVSKSQVHERVKTIAKRGAVEGVKGQRWIVEEIHLKTFKLTKEHLEHIVVPEQEKKPEQEKEAVIEALSSRALSGSSSSSSSSQAAVAVAIPTKIEVVTLAAPIEVVPKVVLAAISSGSEVTPVVLTTDSATSVTTTTTPSLVVAPVVAPVVQIDTTSNYLCTILTLDQRMKYQYMSIDQEIAEIAAKIAKIAAKTAAKIAAQKKRKAENVSSGKSSSKRAKMSLPMGWTAITTVRTSGKCAGSKDTTYISPDGKTKCRSMLEVERFVLALPNTYSLPPQNASKGEVETFLNKKTTTPSKNKNATSDLSKQNPNLTPNGSKRKRTDDSVSSDVVAEALRNKPTKGAIKPRVKKVAKKASSSDASSSIEEDLAINWGQCEECNKWRILNSPLGEDDTFKCSDHSRLCQEPEDTEDTEDKVE